MDQSEAASGAFTVTMYVIRDWNEHFEISESRKYKNLSWVALPNKHDGKSYRRLVRLEDGAAIFGVWIAIVQVASKCPERGVLADADGPLTPEDISDKTGMSESLVVRALEVLSSERIKWIIAVENPSQGSPENAHFQWRASGVPGDSPGAPLIHNPTQPNPTLPNPTQPIGGGGGGKFESPGRKSLGSDAVMDWADEQACLAGIDSLTDEARIWIFAAAERSCRESSKNPSGMFVSLIREYVAQGPTSKLSQYREAGEKRFLAWKAKACKTLTN